MAILTDISGVESSDPGFYFGSSANFFSGLVDFTYAEAPNSSFSSEKILHGAFDNDGNIFIDPTQIAQHVIPPTDPNTGAIFDNQYSGFVLTDSVHAVFYTQPTSHNYNANDLTSLKLQEFDSDGNVIQGPTTLTLGGRSGVKDLYQLSESSGPDFDSTFVVAYSTFNPVTGGSLFHYEQFDDAGDDLGGGVLLAFGDGSRHGLDFGTFYSAGNPNSGGSPDFLLQNRSDGSQSSVDVALFSPDMQSSLGSTTINIKGPAGQTPTAIDRFGHLGPGSTSDENFGVLTQTFEYQDRAGNTHVEIALEKINPTTLRVEARTEFADTNGTASGVGLQHLSNGNILAIYNDGGQSFVKEFNSNLKQVGGNFALPQDNDGWDNFVALGNDQFQIDWRQSTTASSSGPTVQHHAIFQA